jgi:predicted acylesterase/phospholipase RssA
VNTFVLILGPTAGLWPLMYGAGYEVRLALEAAGYTLKAVGGDSGGAMASTLLAAEVDPYQWLTEHTHLTKVGKIGGKNPWTWVLNATNMFMHGGLINTETAYEKALKVAWEPLELKYPCYAYAWSLSTESGAIFPVHKMKNPGWAKAIAASMSLPVALTTFPMSIRELDHHCPEVLSQLGFEDEDEDVGLDEIIYFADGGISSYLPVDMALDVPDLLFKMERDEDAVGGWSVNEEVQDIPLSIAISLDEGIKPKFRRDIADMNPLQKIMFSCMGALRASVYEDIADAEMMGLPHHLVYAPIPEDLSKYGLRFNITAEEAILMFDAGRELVSHQLADIIREHLSEGLTKQKTLT